MGFCLSCCCFKPNQQFGQDSNSHLRKFETDKATILFSKPLADFPIVVKTDTDEDETTSIDQIEISDLQNNSINEN